MVQGLGVTSGLETRYNIRETRVDGLETMDVIISETMDKRL